LGDGETKKLVSILLRVELMNLHPTTCQPNVRLNQKVLSQNFFLFFPSFFWVMQHASNTITNYPLRFHPKFTTNKHKPRVAPTLFYFGPIWSSNNLFAMGQLNWPFA
jgi:hypothetical protein